MLIIDDEADYASVNTAEANEDPKAINLCIRRMLKQCSKVSYVAYTATPFANVFIDPDVKATDPADELESTELVDLFPSHFIVALGSPSNYCGGRFFYADDDTYFRETAFVRRYIQDAESHFPLGHKSDLAPRTIPQSLKEALASFFVASAIKDLRRSSGALDAVREPYDSCLIHVSQFTAVQSHLKHIVQDYVELLWKEVRTGYEKGEGFKAIAKAYSSHYSDTVLVRETWAEVKNALRTMDQPVVVTVHGKSREDLDYETATGPKKVVAIGGLKLSRGLTLDGLVISYLYRRSMMYDTLLQMARWFGYRDGYRDLLRLYTTSTAREWYWHITKASEELKDDLTQMEGIMEPKDFGIRVRSHDDALLVTAKNKMRLATKVSNKESFQNRTKESVFVDVRKEVNHKNLETVDNFFTNHRSTCRAYDAAEKSARFHIIENVDAEVGLSLMRNLEIHWGNKWASTDRLLSYLDKHSSRAFKRWDVAFQTPRTGHGEREVVKGKLTIKTQTRSPFKLLKPVGVGELYKERVKQALALGDNRRVATSSIDYVGIPEAKLSEKHRTNATLARRWKMDNRPNPLLVFHLIHVNLDKSLARLNKKIEKMTTEGLPTIDLKRYKIELEGFMKTAELDDYYLAFSVSIPGNPLIDDDGVSYQINKRAFEEEYGTFEYDE